MAAMKLLGLDHADIRVPSLAVDAAHARNVAEYHTPIVPGSPGWFVGFIDDPGTKPTATRIAFALDAEANLTAIEALVRNAGGCVVEWSIDAGYPARFFEDPAGTRLEICARRPRA